MILLELPRLTKAHTVSNCLISPLDFNSWNPSRQASFEDTLTVKDE